MPVVDLHEHPRNTAGLPFYLPVVAGRYRAFPVF
jgi:hypothetical protein